MRPASASGGADARPDINDDDLDRINARPREDAHDRSVINES
jgi:hypothetical protein